MQGTYTLVLAHVQEALAVLVNRIATAASAVGEATSVAMGMALARLHYSEDLASQDMGGDLSKL